MMPKVKALLVASLALCLAPFANAAKELNLFAWSEYIPQEVIDGFTKETGVKVNYETFSSNEEMLSKLLAGGMAYDLVQPTDYMAELMIHEKMLQKLDLSRIPLLSNIDPAFQHLPHDPAGAYSVPYMSGTVGIVVNTETVKDPIKGFKDVFSGKYSGRLVVLNDSRELVTWAFATLGIGCNDMTPENLAKARPILKAWLPQVKLFDSDSPKTALLNGDVDIGIVWSGEAALLWNESHKFAYVLPEEGAHRFVDLLCIPSKAHNVEAAHLFINYILRPEVSRIISEKFPYTNPNFATRKLLTPDQLGNPASYPKPTQLNVFGDIGKAASAIDKLVTDLKNAQ